VSPAFVVEPVGRDNLDLAARLLTRFFAEEGFATPPEEIGRNLRAALGDGIGWAALAMVGRQAVGVATVQLSRSVEQGLPAEIGDLWVMPEQRRQGVARALVEACCAWAALQGSATIEVTITAEAEARHRLAQFYQRLGFPHSGRLIRMRRLDPSP
jgi:GNAT superfamily N-acetyltransferase